MRSKLLGIFLILSSLAFGQYVPDTETFTLQDVVDAVSPSSNDLSECFADANATYFNPTYNNDLYAPANSMLRFRDYGAHNALGFETYVAPDDFDRTAQPVDIYEVFKQYYKVNHDAKWIYSVTDATTKTVPDGGTSYYYGYDSAGVAKTKNLASGDSVIWYASATKKWVITNHTTATPISCSINGAVATKLRNQGASWLYCGDLINSVNTGAGGGTSSTIKWIHVEGLSNVTKYEYLAHYFNANLQGTLHISTTATELGPVGSALGNSFMGCSGITGTLVIPDNITYIHSQCFYQCSGITGVTIGNSLATIGQGAFSTCSNINGEITFPSSLTTIGNNAFEYCSKLDTVIFSTGALTLGTSAFASCTDLDIVDFKEGLTSIGNYCFNGDVQLDCPLTFPSTLTTVGYGAFLGCTGLNCTLTIPSTILTIGEGAFGNTNFTDIDESNTNYLVYDSVLYQLSPDTLALHSVKSATDSIEFLANTELIGDYCFYNNLRTDTLALTSNITRIGDYAFYNCDGLDKTLIISDEVTTIETYAFYDCDGFDGNLNIPSNVLIVDQYAFYGTQFTSLTIEEGLITIGNSAFRSITTLAGNIVIPNSVVTINGNAFNGNTSLTGTLTLGTSLTTILGGAFNYCPLTGTLAIPSSVTTINEATFILNKFTSITSSATGFTVYDYVLYDETVSGTITAHTSAGGYSGTLTLKSGTTRIGGWCFVGNTLRTGAITIPYTVTYIGYESYRDCSGFNDVVTIGDAINGSNLTLIWVYAFYNVDNVTRYNIYRTPAPTLTTSFAGSPAKELHVKSGATGYNVGTWIDTSVFSSVTYDL